MPQIAGRLSAILDVWVSQNGDAIRLNLAIGEQGPLDLELSPAGALNLLAALAHAGQQSEGRRDATASNGRPTRSGTNTSRVAVFCTGRNGCGVGRFMHWKGGLAAGRVTAARCYDFSDKMIECAPEVVNCVADDHSQPLNGVGSGLPKIEAKRAGLRVFIDERSVTLQGYEIFDAGLRVVDVLIGPLNL